MSNDLGYLVFFCRSCIVYQFACLVRFPSLKVFVWDNTHVYTNNQLWSSKGNHSSKESTTVFC